MRIILPLLLFCLLATGLLYPEFQVSLSASKNIATIGDRIILKIIVKTTPEINNIQVDILEKNFESISKHQLPARKSREHTVFEIHEVVSFFSTGNHTIGPFRVKMIRDHKIVEEKTTNLLDIKIKSVLEKSDQDIKDLKDLISIRGNPFYVLKYVFILLALALLVVLIFLVIRKKKQQSKSRPLLLLSPLEELESSISELFKKNWLEKGRVKQFFIALTEMIKNYLQREYGFNAEDLTTAETMRYVERNEENTTIQQNLEFIFTTADLVKFAKFRPGSANLEAVKSRIDSIISIQKARAIEENKDQDVSVAQ
jgi:hypothetical protein